MSDQSLIPKIDDTVIKMYREDYKCENANQQIYNAILYQFLMLRILAFEMDENGAYSQVIEDILQKSIEEEKKATTIFAQMWNVRYAVFQMLEVVALIADTTGEYEERIQRIRRSLAQNDERAQNINQQIYFVADASYAILSVIAEILDENGAYSGIIDSVAEKYEKSNANCSGIFQQAFCADRASFEILQLTLALVGGQGGISLAESIENRLNEYYKIAKGIFHDIIFVSQASVEAMAFVIVGYAGYDLSAYKLPNWKAIANANREAEKADDSKSIPAEEVPSSPRPQPSPSYAASKPSIPQSSTPSGNGGGCYVATCVYGSYDCPEVWTLRRYRDDTLGATWYGRAFIRFYYAVSPTLVKWFGKTKWFKRLWKGKLDRMVLGLQARGIESTPYKDKQW